MHNIGTSEPLFRRFVPRTAAPPEAIGRNVPPPENSRVEQPETHARLTIFPHARAVNPPEISRIVQLLQTDSSLCQWRSSATRSHCYDRAALLPKTSRISPPLQNDGWLWLLLIGLMALSAGWILDAAPGEEVIALRDGWRFTPGDRIEYARADFNDAGWMPMRVDKVWEEQGFEQLDGYAWFRLHFVIPSRLKQAAFLKDGLRIFLGKINNYDQSFLNGRLFGINGKIVDASTSIDDTFTKAPSSLWSVNRVYVLRPDDPRIKWDQENIIAVRVFDEGGQGGLFSGDQALRMITLGDYLDCDSNSSPFSFHNQNVSKTLTLTNTSSSRSIAGTLSIKALNKLTGQMILSKSDHVELQPGAAHRVSVELPRQDQSSLATYAFTFDPTGEVLLFSEETPYVLTPLPPASPHINGASIMGVRPNRPFLYCVAATGDRPLTYAARGLPAGLQIDSATGMITGHVAERGEYKVTLDVRNEKGTASRSLTIAVGDRIALTPPLGWNSWNCWGLSVDQERVLASARAYKAKGLADHGWTFINIDDGWEIKGDSSMPHRDAQGNIIVNEKFPDMRALGDQIHAMGLKLGIYSSPGPLTCGGYTASYEYERNDARSWANWGVDYLKYDWCSYEKIAKDISHEELQKPYRAMRHILDEIDRDIVYSLCQYGMDNVWEWGADVGGNLWRTTEDIEDTWASVKQIGFSQVENARYAGPGHWNDPDMLVVGWVGWGPNLHPTRLMPDEQYTHISLWCLLSAPLLIGCDLERLDEFTLNLLTNDEVLAIDPDPLGKQAVQAVKEAEIQVWVKELADGNRAVGVFNLGETAKSYLLKFADIGVGGHVKVHDLWRQKDLEAGTDAIPLRIPAHGTLLLRLAAD